MITEHILFYPHNKYNLKRDYTDKLSKNEVVQYGYIKKRDIKKWENNELVAVKMGMLNPHKKGYSHMTILSSALQRIDNQDKESCFEDEDELIPVYVFVSNETDWEWREYLKTRGFVTSRQGKKREGMFITKSDIGLHYGKHYNYDTKEVLSERERIEKEKQLARERRERELQLEKERREKERIEREKLEKERAERLRIERERRIYEYEKVNGENTYNRDLLKQKSIQKTIKEESSIDEKTLELTYVEVKNNNWLILMIVLIFVCICGFIVGTILKSNPISINEIYYGKIICKSCIYISLALIFGTFFVPSTFKYKITISPNGEKEIEELN